MEKSYPQIIPYLSKWGDLPSVCEEHVHTGRLRTRIDNRVFKKSNIVSFEWKKKKNPEKPEKNKKISISTKIKIDKHKYTVAQNNII